MLIFGYLYKDKKLIRVDVRKQIWDLMRIIFLYVTCVRPSNDNDSNFSKIIPNFLDHLAIMGVFFNDLIFLKFKQNVYVQETSR